MQSGEFLGAELFTCGPLFTAPGGHPSEMLQYLPKTLQPTAKEQFLRLPASPEEARRQVDQLRAARVDCIKAVLEAGNPIFGRFNHLDDNIYRAIAAQAAADGLPLATHTGNAADVAEAVSAGTVTVEHGSGVDLIPSETFADMKAKGVAYNPTLSVVEAVVDTRTGNPIVLDRPLLRQVGPEDLLKDTRDQIVKNGHPDQLAAVQTLLDTATKNLLAAYRAGVTLIAGSDAGNIPVIHGPTIQHELALWVRAGIPAPVALQAATANAARALRCESRLGIIAPGRDASLVVVDGDPVTDIAALEHIGSVLFRGERVNRSDLLNQDKP
jgi:imidazolonepropionase-like amidohydrolase